MKSLVIPLVESPRSAKLAFLVILDFCIFPVLIWLCYAIRQFDLGAEVVPNIPFGSVWVSAIAVFALFICGVYRFIVRTFNEFFIAKLGLATILSVIGLYLLAYSTHAFVPTSIPLMFGFMMFAWVWFSRGIIRFVVQSYLKSGVPKKRIAIYGAGHAGQQVAATLNRSNEHLPIIFIDDDPSLSGQNIGGIQVFLPHTSLKCFKKFKIDEILISEEEAFRTVKRGKYYAILPMLPELVDRKIKPALNKEYSSADNSMTLEETKNLLNKHKLMVGQTKMSGEFLK